MSTNHNERLQSEIELLEAMYTDQISFNGKIRELKVTLGTSSFTLRISDRYLVDELPEVLSASCGKSDQREQLRQAVNSMTRGEEVLDAIVTAFSDLTSVHMAAEDSVVPERAWSTHDQSAVKATIVVWLHHLLNTNKRKQALSPTSSAVSGVTKPGYPGVLVYTGPARAVHDHVNELKGLNWQAFQIRLETGEEWSFTHGSGVKEVESMKEIVATVGEERKEVFLEAMRMK